MLVEFCIKVGSRDSSTEFFESCFRVLESFSESFVSPLIKIVTNLILGSLDL